MRIVCVLSGGGAKAAAQLGAVKALLEQGHTVAHYVGTSMGAVVGAALASGLPYERILARVVRLRRRDVAAPAGGAVLGFFGESFLRDDVLRETIGRLVPARRFADLATPLTVTAVDIQNGQLTLFGKGGREHVPLVDALYASCALPLYYPPARIAGRRYVDGGLRAVLPLDVAAQFEPDMIFAVNVGPSLFEEPVERPARLPPLLRAHGGALRVMMASQANDVLLRWRHRGNGTDPLLVLVTPVAEAEATFALENTAGYVEAGYRAAVRELHRRGLAS